MVDPALAKVIHVGAATLFLGYTFRYLLDGKNPIPAPLIWLATGITVLISMNGTKFSLKSFGNAPALPEDPDLKIVSNIDRYIHPDIKQLQAKEIGPKNSSIYVVKFLQPEYCAALIRVAEKYGDWNSKSKGDYGKGMTLPLDFIPLIERNYSQAVQKYLFPVAKKLFPKFNPTHHDEVYILRYRADKGKQQGMEAHYDSEPLACILTLNREFQGGGTYYPKWDFTALAETGEMLLYPGGLSHLHGGKKITAGKRYALLHALYDRELNGDAVSVWETGEPQHTKGNNAKTR